MENSKKNAWNDSYDKKDNYLFYPHEEVIRFVSKYIRKRVGLSDYSDVGGKIASNIKIIDLGCGIGRHVIYFHEMGLQSFGVDLSDSAIEFALKWARNISFMNENEYIRQADIRKLPWDDGFFSFAISHGVLDSMSFDIARLSCIELARVMSEGGLFYCDLISGDDSFHAREFSGEEVIQSCHEHGTIQLYFNLEKINTLFKDIFEIVECNLIRRENIFNGSFGSRYHLVLKKV